MNKIIQVFFEKAGEEENLLIGDRWVGNNVSAFGIFEYANYSVVTVYGNDGALIMEIPMHKVCRIFYGSDTVSKGDE